MNAATKVLLFLLQAKLETKALKAKRPGFTDDRYKETAYYVENGEYLSSTGIGMERTAALSHYNIF